MSASISVPTSALDRDELVWAVLRMQGIAKAQRKLLDELASRSAFVERKLKRFDAEFPQASPTLARHLIRQVDDANLRTTRAAANDSKVWGKFR